MNHPRTVHLPKRVLDAERRQSRIRVRRHDPHNATRLRVQPRRNHPQHNILARKDPRNLLPIVLHHAHGRRPPLAHELRRLAHSRLNTDRRGRRASIEDAPEVGEAHLVSEGLDVGHEGVRRGRVAAELLLGALEGGVELLGGTVGLLELLEGLVEDFGDVEEADDVAVFVADGLRGRERGLAEGLGEGVEGREVRGGGNHG